MLSVLYKKETVNATGFEPRIFQLPVRNLVNQPFLYVIQIYINIVLNT